MADDPQDPGTQDTASDNGMPEQSLAEFEVEFGGDGARPPEPDPEPEPEPGDGERRPPRERDDAGKFVKPEKHRAKSQEVPAKEVRAGRIDELTKKWREAEAERDAIRAERDALKWGRPTTSLPAPTEATKSAEAAKPAVATAKPKIDDFNEYGDYVEALADWKIAEARRQDRETAQKEAETARISNSWRERVDAAKAKHADFEAVALQAPTQIPQGSLIDAWILEDTSGADVLYTLQKDPAELRRILALPLFEQVKALSLIAQRLSDTPEPAVKTGAAARPAVRVAPRPPTPVRTSAVSAPDEPPDPETSSLDQFERYYPMRRRNS